MKKNPIAKREKKSNKKERVSVYFDGSNFYHKLKSKEINIRNTSKFDYAKFAQWLAGKREIVSIRYYVGVVKDETTDKKVQKLIKEQQKLFSYLKQKGLVVKEGYLVKSGGFFHEKGVDVKIAVDLLVGAYEDFYDSALLISSDNDIIPAINKIKSLGKKVEYIGFKHQPSYGLQKSATVTRLLMKKEFKPFENNK
jgi:uncharacterized LabA/DUF88 family protein